MLVDENDLPILTQFSEDGFVDCVFAVGDLRSEESHYAFRLLASHEGETVGLSAQIVRPLEPGFDDDLNLIQEHVYRHGVTFTSLGEISDRLLSAIADLYGFETAGRRMNDQESFTAIALQQDPTDFENATVKLKLFGRDGMDQSASAREEDYFESFFNVDLSNRVVCWNEKDPEYRHPLIRGLSTEAG